MCRSKKHKEQVQLLRFALEAEEFEISGVAPEVVDDLGLQAEVLEEIACESRSNSGASIPGCASVEEGSEESSASTVEQEEESEAEMDEDAMLASLLASHNRAAAGSANLSTSSSNEEEAGATYALESLELGADSDVSDVSWGGAPKKGKRRGKQRGNSAHFQSKLHGRLPEKGNRLSADVPAKELQCGVCGEEFLSRNQLFKHIQRSGHAQLKMR